MDILKRHLCSIPAIRPVASGPLALRCPPRFSTSPLRHSRSTQAGDDAWAACGRANHPDFALLSGPRGGCTALAVLPLCAGTKCPGALLLGHTGPLAPLLQQRCGATGGPDLMQVAGRSGAKGGAGAERRLRRLEGRMGAVHGAGCGVGRVDGTVVPVY